MTTAEIAYLGLGSNVGDRSATIESALRALRRVDGVEVMTVSHLIETEPVGPVEQGAFLNGAAKVRTTLSPRELLDACLAIEREHGRDRAAERRWGPRTLDIDLLLFGDRVIDLPGLQVPHPRLQLRAFVLDPLSEIASGARHPVLDATVEELRQRLAITN